MKRADEVFTPRQAAVNERMYVNRQNLETDFSAAISSGLHILIHGESGCGKSWLYKQYCKARGIHLEIANLANAQRLGSITKEIENVIDREGGLEHSTTIDKIEAKADVVVAKGGTEHSKTYTVRGKEPFEECLALAKKHAGGKRAFLVLDNLEVIFDDDKLMGELASLITLLDDERYSQYGVRLLIVGVPSGVREYFNRTPNRATVANRIRELPEVSRLTIAESSELIQRGFKRELGLEIKASDEDAILKHISWVTDRVPQRLHEYCLELALVTDGARSIDASFLRETDKRWLQSSLSHSYGSVENLMNERDTKIGRRNQVLYCLGLIDRDEFRATEIEALVRQEFPTSTASKTLNVVGILPEISNTKDSVLKRTPKGDAFMFADPRFKMALRAMLIKQNDESVARVQIGNLR